jgi:amino acid adenylation domain-containing protein
MSAETRATNDWQGRLANLTPEKRALLLERIARRPATAPRAPSAAIAPTERSPDGRHLPSFGQERLWFLDRLEETSAAFNIPVAFRISGPLDVAVLRRALDEVVRRHEVLRTTFVHRGNGGGPDAQGGEAFQVIHPSLPVPFEAIDIAALPAGEREAEALRLVTEAANRPFDLAIAPLLRALLVRLSGADHVLLLSVHHIAADGWSMDILYREIEALYGAFLAGRPSPLPELPIQFVDFAAWQRQMFAEDALSRQLEYWKSRLAGLVPLELFADRPRPAVQTSRGDRVTFAVPAGVAGGLRALGREHGLTLFMVLLAAFKVFLSRHTGKADVAVGTPIAGRTRPEVEGLIGFFINTLVMRTDLGGDPTFVELCARVKEVALGAYAHQDLPFEKLVEELQPERHLDHDPLFQVMFALQHTPSVRPEALGAAAGGAGAPAAIRSVAKLDLAMSLGETADGLSGELEYKTDLFDTATATRMIRHYLELLAGVAARPDARLFELPLLTPEERRQILCEWSGGARERQPAPAAAREPPCVHRLFEAQVDRTPAAIAIESGGRTWTYEALDRRANRLARRLRALGAGPDHPVGVCLRRSVDAACVPLAALKAGAAYLPLDPDLPRARLELMIEDAGARIVVTEGLLADLLADLPGMDVAETRPDAAVGPDDLAYIIYTSGSTGRPEGVAMPHRPLAGLLAWHMGDPELARPRRTLQLAALGFDVSFQEMLATWCTGGALVLVDDDTRRDPARLLGLIADAAIERLFLPPVVLAQLAEVAAVTPCELGSVREIVTAGEQLVITPAIHALVDRIEGCVLRNQYGPTETHVVTEHVLRGSPRSWPATPPIGRPIAGARAYVLDEHLQLVPAGIAGELYLGGAAVSRGYQGRAARTAERFVPDPFGRVRGGRLYRTGDRARYLADGSIQLLGRADRGALDDRRSGGLRIRRGLTSGVRDSR